MKLALIPNASNAHARNAAQMLRVWLEQQGFACDVLDEPPVQEVEMSEEAVLRRILPDGTVETPVNERAERVRSSDMVVALGGDGTTLHAARLVADAQVPILSVNFGTLGFLSGGLADTMTDVVTTALAGEMPPSRRATLEVSVIYSDGSETCYFCLNEAAVSRGALGHIIDYRVDINGVHLSDMRGDGIIVATATGSTAHALSAGGPIVSPAVMGPVVVPMASHTLQSRPIVCGPSDVVEITLEEDPASAAVVFVDGKITEHEAPVSVIARRGRGDTILLQSETDRFYHAVADTFFR